MKVWEYNAILNEERLPVLKETRQYIADGRKTYDNPRELADLFGETVGMKNACEEYAYCLALNNRLKPVAVFEVGHGTMDSSLVDTRGMFQKLLMVNAHSFAFAHNHPSGIPAPSFDDNVLTEKIKNGADSLNIRFIDHVIIGDGVTYSYTMDSTF